IDATRDSSCRACNQSRHRVPESDLRRRPVARRKGDETTTGTESREGFSSFGNELLGLPKDSFFLWVAGARDRVIDRKPFDAVHFSIVLGGISICKFQKVEGDDFEYTDRWFFPLGRVRVLDGVKFGDDGAGQAGFFPCLPLSRCFRFFTGLDEA